MDLSEGCVFCEEIETGVCEYEGVNKGVNNGGRIIYETDNFWVVPAVGQIVEGYLLINSKKHFLSMGGMPLTYFSELEEVCSKVKNVLSETYGSPIFFEHGMAEVEKKKMCCIAHAHIHAVPVIIDDISKELDPYGCVKEIRSLIELNYTFMEGKSYLFFENNSGRKYISDVTSNIPPQLLRQIIAEKTGNKDKWNWKDHPGIEAMLSTIETLKGKF
ncbi:MAG: HIT family protein [Candidatus Nanoarchaeia archaeon]